MGSSDKGRSDIFIFTFHITRLIRRRIYLWTWAGDGREWVKWIVAEVRGPGGPTAE